MLGFLSGMWRFGIRMTTIKKEPKHNDELLSTKGVSPAFSKLLDYATNINPKFDAKKYLNIGREILQAVDMVSKQIASFQADISQMPYLAFVMLWASSIKEDSIFGERYILMMRELLENNLIPHRQLTAGQAAKIDPEHIFNNIRCYKKWSLDKREDYIALYCQFTAWASETTFGYFTKTQDPDRQVTMNRSLPYDTYIKIAKELSDRDRILAKIFYLGGSRPLEEVLSLQIKDVNFENNTLTLSQEQIYYPKHVLEDIQEYIGNRKSGYVFLGRHGEKIDHTVPYRALKNVILKLNLDPSFTFKDFVKNS